MLSAMSAAFNTVRLRAKPQIAAVPLPDATDCLCCLQAQRDVVYIAQGDACFCDGDYIAAARLYGKVRWDLSFTLVVDTALCHKSRAAVLLSLVYFPVLQGSGSFCGPSHYWLLCR